MKDIRFAKFLVFINGGVPLAILTWDAFNHHLGANPANFAILTTGMLTLVFLMLTLMVTPLRKLTGWNWLIFSRRTFGLYAFFYGCAHFLIFFALDRSFSISSTLSEMAKRNYLLVGITALLLMVPLAVTSTNAMIKRLGAKRWHNLHRLVYVTAILGVLHFYMQKKSKADLALPLTFAVGLGFLLGFRILAAFRRTPPAAAAAAPAPKAKLWSGPLRVVSITPETPDVRTIRLASPDGNHLPFTHQPGQYLVLSLVIDGKKVNRTYTIASSPTQPAWCEITVKREDLGQVSGHLHANLREGDLIQVSAPAGRFTFDGTSAASVVLIAGGVGITPLMSILRYLTDQRWSGEIHFLFTAKTPADIIFRQELEDLQKRFSNLRFHLTLTRADKHIWSGRHGRISRELLREIIPDLASHPVYICGPASMMEPTKQLLRGLGVPAHAIQSEAFTAAKRAEVASTADLNPMAAPAATDPSIPQLTFAKSLISVPLVAGKPLLEIAEAAGVNLDFECRSGICGRCKTKLLAGSVTMDTQDALNAEDKANNVILLCQAKAAENVTIEA